MRRALPALLAVIAGCPAPALDEVPPSAPRETKPAPNALGEAAVLTMDAFDVEPGTESQRCQTFTLPFSDVTDIVRIEINPSGMPHHTNVYRWKPGKAPSDTGLRECQPGEAQTHGDAEVLFGATGQGHLFDTPEHVAFRFDPGTQILVEQHVVNATRERIRGGGEVVFHTHAYGVRIDHLMFSIWLANWGLVVPPGQTAFTAECELPSDVTLTALTSHMHTRGTRFRIDHVVDGDATRLYESTSWSDPPFLMIEPARALSTGNRLRWTCEYDNTEARVVIAGDASTDEMCVVYGFGYAGEGQGEPVNCNTPTDPYLVED